jgi:hypothetical protein
MPLVFFYKITLDAEILYVGSASNLHERERLHCLASKADPKPLYKIIREHGGWPKVRLQVLERPFCIDAKHRRCREQYWLEVIKPPCNLMKASVDGIAL